MNNPHPIRAFLPVIIFLITICIWIFLASSKPEARKKPGQQTSNIVVDTVTLESGLIRPRILSYGAIEAQIASKLVAQVTGRIESVSEQFRDGGYFNKGDLLLSIEDLDYEIEVEIAAANLLDAERQLEEEQARVTIAEDEWRRLGTEKEPAALALRRPQLKAAEANLKAAKARLRRAELNLDRTKIRAPFDGRVISTTVDLGQVVSNNAVLGDIYASGAAEIRLPIKTSDLPLIDIESPADLAKLQVNITSSFDANAQWPAKIIRSASALDNTTRQMYLVAEVDEAFEVNKAHGYRLRVGQYVTADIEGKSIDSALALPNKAIFQGSYVYIYEEGAVFRREITIAWQDEGFAIIKSGVSEGDRVVISPMGNVASGTRVRLAGEKPKRPRPNTSDGEGKKREAGDKPS